MVKKRPAAFGRLLRELRTDTTVSLGAAARHLGVSVTYLSDVERGKRPPLSGDRIYKLGKYIALPESQVQSLFVAAAEDMESVSLPTPTSRIGREATAALMRGWENLDDDVYHRILKLLGKDKE